MDSRMALSEAGEPTEMPSDMTPILLASISRKDEQIRQLRDENERLMLLLSARDEELLRVKEQMTKMTEGEFAKSTLKNKNEQIKAAEKKSKLQEQQIDKLTRALAEVSGQYREVFNKSQSLEARVVELAQATPIR